MHELMAATLEKVISDIRRIQTTRAQAASRSGPRWPMIVLRTPKGWTGPKEIDGKRDEGYWRSHQVPMSAMHGNPEHCASSKHWMKSYRPRSCSTRRARFRPELAALAPRAGAG